MRKKRAIRELDAERRVLMVDRISYTMARSDLDSSEELPDRMARLFGTTDSWHDHQSLADDRGIARSAGQICEAIRRKDKVLVFTPITSFSCLLTAMMIRGLDNLGIEADWLMSGFPGIDRGISMKQVFEIEMTDADSVILLCRNRHESDALSQLEAYGIHPVILPVTENHLGISEMTWSLLCSVYKQLGRRCPEDLLPYFSAALTAEGGPVLKDSIDLVKSGQEWHDHSVFPCFRLTDKNSGSLKLADICADASSCFQNRQVMEFLLTDSMEQAETLLNQMDSCRQKARETASRMLDELLEKPEFPFSGFQQIFCQDTENPVAGQAAAWLSGKLNRAVGVICNIGNRWRVSAGFPSQSHMQAAVSLLSENEEVSSVLQCGYYLSVETENLDSVLSILKRESAPLANAPMIPSKIVDLEIGQDELIPESWDEIRTFITESGKNRWPLFLCRGLKTVSVRRAEDEPGKLEAVLKLTEFENETIAATGPGLGDFADILPAGVTVDVICHLGIHQNKEGGERTLILELADLLYDPVYTPGTTVDEDTLYVSGLVGIPEILEEYSLPASALVPDARELNQIHKTIRQMLKKEEWVFTDLSLLTPVTATRAGLELPPFKLARALEILSESGAIHCRRLSGERLILKLPENDVQVQRLSRTETYQNMIRQLQEAGQQWQKD